MKPIPDQFYTQISQPFLVPNQHYKSGVHNGVDFRCPIGTPVYAPRDGEITRRYLNHASLGVAVYFACEGSYLRFLHLSEAKLRGQYKQGDIIGYTGNTGDSTGPHLHVDVWKVPIDTSLIQTKRGVLDNLVDPLLFFDGVI